MKNKIITFGELLLRFSKDQHNRLQQGRAFFGDYGGSEANVAVSLATLGDDVEYVTRVPDSPIGRASCMKLREFNVGTQHVLYGGDRMGSYYYEGSAGMRSSKVIYDRAYSSFYYLEPGMIDWRKIFADAAVFHASGIAGAVSKESADATFEALDIADEMGLTLSFDINYRKNLWKYGAEPKATLSKMLNYADVVFADVIEYEYMTDRKVPFPAMSSDYEMPMEVYREWFDEIHARWPRCKKWLMGMRNMISSSRNTLTALLWDDGKLYSTRIYDIQGIVDSMGVGDAFTAGQLHAINAFGNDSQKILDYALAAATLKYSIAGDYNLATDEEIQTLMKG